METIINIERRESGCSTWHVFCPRIHADNVDRQLDLWHHQYPEHHFRAVRVTITRETLKKVAAKTKSSSCPVSAV